ncbi:hypothetical protein H920_13732 [Fukomys damarensis]|uniref:Uncharacterized protein n=1 Tax=Fukomys damarensis TaxID=885580 RepID=A0A091D3W5_FUKDA|nr:hypothetical protein H920_13732 [Fukomys damarensis]
MVPGPRQRDHQRRGSRRFPRAGAEVPPSAPSATRAPLASGTALPWSADPDSGGKGETLVRTLLAPGPADQKLQSGETEMKTRSRDQPEAQGGQGRQENPERIPPAGAPRAGCHPSFPEPPNSPVR